jgi:cbb3-type cytochrome oxidase maturation protein
MDVIYGLIPGMIILGLVAVGIFFWAARSGQFDDMEGEAHRILMDEDLHDVKPVQKHEKENKSAADGNGDSGKE